MADSKKVTVRVGGRMLALSNLDRVVCRAGHDALTKAQIIEYYVRMAPVLIRHIKGRAISFVRYPDGIEGEAFYQKSRPDYTPDWIADLKLGDTPYLLLQDDASLVWVANQNCLELHIGAGRLPDPDRPDYIVFDVDPPPDISFALLQNLVLELREWIQDFGYTVFVKWSGRKGFHLVAPLVTQTAEVDGSDKSERDDMGILA